MSTGSAAWQRIAETLVGAAVGIAANLLLPPKVASADAGRAIDGLADSVKELLYRAADGLTELAATRGREVSPTARMWLDDARRITHDIPRVGAVLLRAEQGRRLNVRAVGTADVGPGLRQGLEALEHAAVAIRGLFRALADATYDATWVEEDSAQDVLLGLAQTLREMGDGVDAFGQLVRDEADPVSQTSSVDVRTLRQALDGLHEARARLEDLLVSSDSPELSELHAAVLSTVKRLQREMDLDERVRRQVRLTRRTRPRLPQRGRQPASPRDEPPEPSPDAETQLLPRMPGDS